MYLQSQIIHDVLFCKHATFMKQLVIGWILILSTTIFAQVGINTTTPEGTLDVVTTNNTGLVLPRVSSVEAVTDGNGNDPVDGTVVFDLSRNTTCFFQDGIWACIDSSNPSNPVIVGVNPNPTFNDTSPNNYIKASNTDIQDRFGNSVSISGDGNILAIGVSLEDSCTTGINGDQTDNGCNDSGVVYVFSRSAGVWSQQAYIKASNTNAGDLFGSSISISNDGNTLAVGATREASCATGINGDQTDNGCNDSGVVYVFSRSAGVWSQQAYIKASNTNAGDLFGSSISISNDGNTLAVGATSEDSNATGVNGDQNNNFFSSSGAVYIFTRTGSTWSQQAYIKASNTNTSDEFGNTLSFSGDGNILAISAFFESSCATGINGDQTDNNCFLSGAVYIFTRTGSIWSQQAYINASNTEFGDIFASVKLSNNGDTLAVVALSEDSCATGINGNQNNNDCGASGCCVYIYKICWCVVTTSLYQSF